MKVVNSTHSRNRNNYYCNNPKFLTQKSTFNFGTALVRMSAIISSVGI